MNKSQRLIDRGSLRRVGYVYLGTNSIQLALSLTSFNIILWFNWALVLWKVLQNHHLFVCLPVSQFGIFLRNGSLVFSDFLYDGRYLEYLKTDWVFFYRKIHFCPNLAKKGPKWPKHQRFLQIDSIILVVCGKAWSNWIYYRSLISYGIFYFTKNLLLLLNFRSAYKKVKMLM